MFWMKKNLLAAVCFVLVVIVSGAVCGWAQAGRQTAPPASAAPATASPTALPGDGALPPVDVQLHVDMGPPAGTPPKEKLAIATPALPFDLALEAAKAALDSCVADGYAVGVAVSDEKGQMIVSLRADGSVPRSVYVAARKNFAAVTFKVPTSALRAMAGDSAFLAQIKPNMAVLPGSLPIMIGDRVVGAIGASGASAYQEEKCAGVGLEKIKSRLK